MAPPGVAVRSDPDSLLGVGPGSCQCSRCLDSAESGPESRGSFRLGGEEGKARAESESPASFPFWRNRPNLLKALCERLLEQMCLTEQEAAEGSALVLKNGKDAGGRRPFRKRPFRIRTFHPSQLVSVPPDELQWPQSPAGRRGLRRQSGAEKRLRADLGRGGDTLRSGHEGAREAWEEQPLGHTVFSAGRRLEEPCRMLGRRPPPPAQLPQEDRGK